MPRFCDVVLGFQYVQANKCATTDMVGMSCSKEGKELLVVRLFAFLSSVFLENSQLE
jgi:hypothetical protein